MRVVSIEIVILLLTIVVTASYTQAATKLPTSTQNSGYRRCQKPANGQHLCFCGKKKVAFDRLKGEKCFKGQVVKKEIQRSDVSKVLGLRLAAKPIHRSTRDENKLLKCTRLVVKQKSYPYTEAYVPLRNVSVEAWIDSFAAEVTLSQTFVNEEENPIEAIYIFPIEENAAVYSFTADIDNRTIKAVLKEKDDAEKEYQSALQQGQTAVLIRQSAETLDTFTVNVGALPPGKECRITIRYVTELELVEENSIRFVVPTTIAARYNPSWRSSQTPDGTDAEYVQKTPYSMWFQAHILRGDEYKIKEVANLSHPVNASISRESIDVTLTGIALDRDIILDIDLPANRPSARAVVEHYDNSSKYAVLLAFTPRLSDFVKVSGGKEEINTEFIFIVDCSGSMSDESRIDLAREAMLLFVRSLPMGSHFNIIRFGSSFDILFKNETHTVVYDEITAEKAANLSRSMQANFGGTELLEPLKYLKDHPPLKGRSRQVFLLTDGEISNTNEVIELCRSMSSNTRIFSFGLGHSPSHSLVKGLARSTNGYYVFVPPTSKVDAYVGSQLGRALQPSLLNARLEWHGLSQNGLQAPKKIPPLYVNDRVLIYQLFENDELRNRNATVDLRLGEHKMISIAVSGNNAKSKQTIHRLAAKALIQELQHEKYDTFNSANNSTLKKRITELSLNYQILSPYTAFVGIETNNQTNNTIHSAVRYIPIQISKGDQHLFSPQYSFQQNMAYGMQAPAFAPMSIAQAGPMGMGSIPSYSSPVLHGPPSLSQKGTFKRKFQHYDSGLESHDFAPNTVSLSTDPVRWLIDQQSFNGAWILSEQNVQTLTNGKALSTFHSNLTKNNDALTTALAIALLELKYPDRKDLWYGVAEKGRKKLKNFGLSNDQVNLLINEIKKKL